MKSKVVFEMAWFALCRQGFPLVAEVAIVKWTQGTTFELGPEIQLTPLDEDLVHQANWEVERTSCDY